MIKVQGGGEEDVVSAARGEGVRIEEVGRSSIAFDDLKNSQQMRAYESYHSHSGVGIFNFHRTKATTAKTMAKYWEKPRLPTGGPDFLPPFFSG